eukprot:PhF_6_TR5529/c0_g1_i1/m.7852
MSKMTEFDVHLSNEALRGYLVPRRIRLAHKHCYFITIQNHPQQPTNEDVVPIEYLLNLALDPADAKSIRIFSNLTKPHFDRIVVFGTPQLRQMFLDTMRKILPNLVVMDSAAMTKLVGPPRYAPTVTGGEVRENPKFAFLKQQPSLQTPSVSPMLVDTHSYFKPNTLSKEAKREAKQLVQQEEQRKELLSSLVVLPRCVCVYTSLSTDHEDWTHFPQSCLNERIVLCPRPLCEPTERNIQSTILWMLKAQQPTNMLLYVNTPEAAVIDSVLVQVYHTVLQYMHRKSSMVVLVDGSKNAPYPSFPFRYFPRGRLDVEIQQNDDADVNVDREGPALTVVFRRSSDEVNDSIIDDGGDGSSHVLLNWFNSLGGFQMSMTPAKLVNLLMREAQQVGAAPSTTLDVLSNSNDSSRPIWSLQKFAGCTA